ncbi:MAG: TIGR00266 family protein [Planctomycetes bacterium]|nr:TIGR00266 family protein [Planctomycetota bacterium]
MNIEIADRGAFSSALVHLEPGEQFVSESGAMYRASSNIDINVTTKTRGRGGILGGLKRMIAKENFFFSTYQVTDGQPGEVGLAPVHLGSVRRIDVTPETRWICAGGSYLASGADLQIDTQFQGFKGFFSGEALFFVEVHGTGPLLVSAFGRIAEHEVDGELIVDTGHVVAFSETLSYSVSKAGGSWLQSWLSGEGIALRFSGRGKILVQSHNPKEFGGLLGPKLPKRSS